MSTLLLKKDGTKKRRRSGRRSATARRKFRFPVRISYSSERMQPDSVTTTLTNHFSVLFQSIYVTGLHHFHRCLFTTSVRIICYQHMSHCYSSYFNIHMVPALITLRAHQLGRDRLRQWGEERTKNGRNPTKEINYPLSSMRCRFLGPSGPITPVSMPPPKKAGL